MSNTAACSACGAGLAATEIEVGTCYPCQIRRPPMPLHPDDAVRREAAEAVRARKARVDAVMLTTEAYPAGIEILRRIDIIAAECPFGMNIFRDLFAGVRDVVGGRSRATQKVLAGAKREVLYELREQAEELGANAVIGVSLSYSQFSGKDKSMLFVVASGTAVEIA